MVLFQGSNETRGEECLQAYGIEKIERNFVVVFFLLQHHNSFRNILLNLEKKSDSLSHIPFDLPPDRSFLQYRIPADGRLDAESVLQQLPVSGLRSVGDEFELEKRLRHLTGTRPGDRGFSGPEDRFQKCTLMLTHL